MSHAKRDDGHMHDGNDELIADATQALAAGDLSRARLACNRILENTPNDVAALTKLAEIELAAGDLHKVIAPLERVRDLEPFNATRRHDLGMMLAQTGQLGQASTELAAGLALAPGNLLLRLHAGMIDIAKGDRLRGCGHYLIALDQARDAPQPPLTRSLLDQASQVILTERRVRISTALDSIRKQSGNTGLHRIDECASAFLGARHNRYSHPKWRPDLMYIPDLPPRPFYEREDFPWIEQLEAATSMIREEMLALHDTDQPAFQPYIRLAEDDPSADSWGGLNQSMQWASSHLFRHGEPITSNLAQCPRTRELLESLPLMRIPGHAPEVVFSRLRPGAHIPPHYGSVNGRLIVHLPLVVPPDCGALRAAGESRPWVEGRCLIFDDSFEHDAWNASKLPRVVMLLDIWNPNLTPTERDAFSALLIAIDEFGDVARSAALDAPRGATLES